MTCSANHKHAYAVLGKKPNKTTLGKTGRLSHSAKVVQQYTTDGSLVATYQSGVDAANALGISAKTISKCALGNLKTYKTSSGSIKDNYESNTNYVNPRN